MKKKSIFSKVWGAHERSGKSTTVAATGDATKAARPLSVPLNGDMRVLNCYRLNHLMYYFMYFLMYYFNLFKLFFTMKNFSFFRTGKLILSLVIGASILFTGCSEVLTDEVVDIAPASLTTKALRPQANVIIPHNTVISSNTTWTNNNVYLLEGKVYVVSPATLTVQAGTLVEGAYNATPENASALVITRGAKINAQGTATDPIVFTADEDHQQKGGWGGLVLLGSAPINQPDQVIEGIDPSTVPAGVDVYYGGGGAGQGNANDNSGVLSYVRVEYAGAAIAEANELNAFTFGGVGSGTTLDHLQAYYGADDAFEFFGGTVNATYLVSTATDDDAFDFDFGYTGCIQFAVSTVDPSMSYSSDPNGIECDNDKTGTAATPFTHPKLSNLTIVGTQSGSSSLTSLKSAANFRRNTQFTLVNSILYGYPTGLLLESTNPNLASLVFENNVIAKTGDGVYWTKNPSSITWTMPQSNDLVASASDIILDDPFGSYYTSDALRPTGGAAIDGNYYTCATCCFTATAYKGAIDDNSDTDNWLFYGFIDGWIIE